MVKLLAHPKTRLSERLIDYLSDNLELISRIQDPDNQGIRCQEKVFLKTYLISFFRRQYDDGKRCASQNNKIIFKSEK